MYLLLAKLLLCFLLFIQHKNEIWHLKAWSVKKLKGNKLLRVWHNFTTFELVYIEKGGNDPDVTHLILRMNELFSRVVTVFIILNITFSFLNWLKYAQNRLLPYITLFKIDYLTGISYYCNKRTEMKHNGIHFSDWKIFFF